jgi:hypothetical protein
MKDIKLDTLGRRDRFTRKPQPEYYKGNLIDRKLNAIDIERLAFIARHGGRLPTTYIFEATKDQRRCIDTTRRRLAQLLDMGYLEREIAQIRTSYPHSNEIVHKLTDKAVKFLKDNGLWSNYFPKIGGWHEHQVMTGCLSAATELNARKYGNIKYTPQHELCEELGHDIAIRNDKGGVEFEPDFMFVLDYLDTGARLFVFREADRATESGESSDDGKKSQAKSVKQYRELISTKRYKTLFGASDDDGAIVQITTTTPSHQSLILRQVDKIFERPCSYIMVSVMPEFGFDFHPPRSIDALGMKYKLNKQQPLYSLMSTEVDILLP